jgi:hypothetical protein
MKLAGRLHKRMKLAMRSGIGRQPEHQRHQANQQPTETAPVSLQLVTTPSHRQHR